MSENLDKFARDLLEKTRARKLDWKRYLNPVRRGEEYILSLDEGYRFSLWKRVSGDDCTVTLQLSDSNQPTTIDSVANNWPPIGGGVPTQEVVRRFRLYSDLFDAVRESVYGKDETLDRVEQLLRKIG